MKRRISLRRCLCDWAIGAFVQQHVVRPPAFWGCRGSGNEPQTWHQSGALVDETPQDGCLEELRAAAAELDRQGFWWRPSWVDLRQSKRPPQNLGEWTHGWQHWASSVTDTHGRRISTLTGRPASRQAHVPRALALWQQCQRRVVPRADSSRARWSSSLVPRALSEGFGRAFQLARILGNLAQEVIIVSILSQRKKQETTPCRLRVKNGARPVPS